VLELVDRVREKLNKPPRKPLHFRDLKHPQKVYFTGEIARTPLRAVNILIHKPSLREPETFQERYRLYFYAVRLLLERVSWCCRDNRILADPGDGTAEIIFSNRSGMSHEELKQYLDHLKTRSQLDDVRIAWETINTTHVRALTPGKRAGLQVADAVATATFKAVELDRLAYTEDRYVRMLRPVLYARRKIFLGYGLKLWPREAQQLVQTDPSLEWLRTHFA